MYDNELKQKEFLHILRGTKLASFWNRDKASGISDNSESLKIWLVYIRIKTSSW